MAAPTNLVVKWGGQQYNIKNLQENCTIADLKLAIEKETNVLSERQKLLGLKYKGKFLIAYQNFKTSQLPNIVTNNGVAGGTAAVSTIYEAAGKPPSDDILLSDLKLKPGSKIMMMGTREEEIADANEAPSDTVEVVDDFDIEDEEVLVENREEFLAKVGRRVKDLKVDILNEPRPGKKLLVLDVDYTLFDHKSTAESGYELMRPYLHEFLTSAYENYDIVIWSATSMKWIQAKMQELGITRNTNYKLTFMLDSSAMITVHTPKYGVVQVKPLGVIWGKFEQYSSRNTIMFDDVRRNFLMNPNNGLKIRPFKQAHFNRDKDKELLYLTKYLRDIAAHDDFTQLDHRRWERYKPSKKLKAAVLSPGDNGDEGDAADV